MSKYAAQGYYNQGPSQSYLSHFMKAKNENLDHVEMQSNHTDAFAKTGREMIQEAKENRKNILMTSSNYFI